MSIYEFLKEKNTENTASDSCSLPDSGDLCLRAGEAWVPGAFEGTILRTDIRIKQHLLMNYLDRRSRQEAGAAAFGGTVG